MAKKNNTMTGEPGKRDCVVQNPDGTYVSIYFGSRATQVPINEATRFTEEKAKEWVEEQTAEMYDTRTGLRVETPDLDGPDEEFYDWRSSTRHKVQRVKTEVVEEIEIPGGAAPKGELAAMTGAVADAFGALGVDGVQIGSTTIRTRRPAKPTEPLTGFGDDIRIGDIVYIIDTNNKAKTPDFHKLEDGKPALCRIENYSLDRNNPFINWTEITGARLGANYVGDGWRRTFKLAPENEAAQFREYMRFEGLHVRVLFDFGHRRQAYLVPVSLICYYGGDIRKAAVHDTPYGSFYRPGATQLRLKTVKSWVKTGLFKDFTMKSKVPVPADLPFSLEEK